MWEGSFSSWRRQVHAYSFSGASECERSPAPIRDFLIREFGARAIGDDDVFHHGRIVSLLAPEHVAVVDARGGREGRGVEGLQAVVGRVAILETGTAIPCGGAQLRDDGAVQGERIANVVRSARISVKVPAVKTVLRDKNATN